MDLTIDEIEKCLCRVFTSKEMVCIDDGEKDIKLVFIQPDNHVKLAANSIYDKVYKDALDDGILSLKDLEKLIKERNIFTSEDEAEVDNLKSKLEGQRVLLSKTTKVKARSDRIKEVIAGLEREIRIIEHKKYSKLSMAAETKAEEERSNYLCWSSIYDENGESLYWLRYEDFLKEDNMSLRGNVLAAFLKFYGGIDTKIVRYIARSSLWRIRYVTSQKVSDPLFGVPTSQYTNDMMNLAYWSNFYQNIYEMLPEDRPSDLLIEDDEALDAYMQAYYKERNQEDNARRSRNTTRGKLSAFNSEEVIVTKSNELYEDIEYDKPKEARAIKDKADIRKKARRRTRKR